MSSFESGRCTPEAFATGFIEEWRLPITAAAFLKDFRCWPKHLWPGAAALLADGQFQRGPFSTSSATRLD
jgi:hypothetical protein